MKHKITKTEWDNHLEDYKSIKNGQHYILKFVEGSGTCLVPVEIVPDKEIKDTSRQDNNKEIMKLMAKIVKLSNFRFEPDYKPTPEECIAMAITNYFEWDSRIVDVCKWTLIDANFHDLAEKLEEVAKENKPDFNKLQVTAELSSSQLDLVKEFIEKI